MHAKQWTILAFAGGLSVGPMSRGQVAPPVPPRPVDVNQDVLIQPLQPGVVSQPDAVRLDSLPGQPPLALVSPAGPQPFADTPTAPPRALVQVQPGMPAYGGGYRVVTRGQGAGSWLGLAVSPTPEALRRQLRLRDRAGLVVEQVMPNSPADRAGIEQYDVLETLDDHMLTNPQELVSLVRSRRSGDEVTLGIIREGKRREVTVKVSRSSANAARPPAALPRFAPDQPYGNTQQFRFFARPQPMVPAAPSPFSRGQSQPRQQGSSVSLYYQDGQLYATIYDAGGRVMMTGPVDALRDQKGIPADARRTLKQLRENRSTKDKPAKSLKKHRQSEDREDEGDDVDEAPRGR